MDMGSKMAEQSRVPPTYDTMPTHPPNLQRNTSINRTPLLRESKHSFLRSTDGGDLEVGKASKWGVSITTFKSVIGGGFIALPFALMQAGLVSGLIVIVVVWLCTSLTTKQLVECSKRIKEEDPTVSLEDVDYGKLGEAAYAKWGGIAAVIPLLATQFIAGCAYIVFISTTMTSVLAPEDSSANAEQLHLFITLAVVALECAVAMAPTPAFLINVANLGCFALLFALAFIFAAAGEASPPRLAHTAPFEGWGGLYVCFGISCFTFSAHAEAVSIYASAAPTARSAYLRIIDAVLLVAAAVYVAVAVYCYLCFGGQTNSIIFENLGATWANSLVKTCICAMLLCNYPLTVYPVHQSLELLFGLKPPPPPRGAAAAGAAAAARLTRAQAAARAAVVAASGLLAAGAGEHFGFVSAIGGGFNGVIAFVLPPAFHARLHGGWRALRWWEAAGCALLLVFGAVGGGGSVIQGVQGLLGASDDR